VVTTLPGVVAIVIAAEVPGANGLASCPDVGTDGGCGVAAGANVAVTGKLLAQVVGNEVVAI